MEFATGAMSSLLPKLGELLLEEYNLQKSLKKGIEDLRDELLIIEAALVKVSDVPLDQLDPLVKNWANDVRELSYAIEDNLDSFMVRVEGVESEKRHPFKEFIKKTYKKATKLKIRREIANEIKDVKIRVKEVKERYDRYNFIGNTSATTKVDPRLFALYKQVSNLVGIDKAIDELSKRLSESNASEQNLKITSVVGFGGLGKTTLAKAVYENLNKNFDCGSFVSVGRNPDQKKLLRDILYELDKQKFNYITESQKDERQLIDQLQAFLTDKRYLIVIDDIWDISTWEILKCALVDSNSGSRIITTTRIHEVANIIGGIYNMQPLSNEDSEKLFYSRIFGIGTLRPQDKSSELSDKIVTKCGGVPLSIITLASLLVSKPRDDWYKVFDTIGFGHEVNEAVVNTRKILAFSYYDLPFYLKNCLLHLSTYPEDYFIDKRWVIWKWIAEGFIPFQQRRGAFEVAESYYNDLVNRCMIKEEIDYEEGCHVHDLVLDLIRGLSNEVNFVTIQDMAEYNTCSTSTSSRSRRLAIHGGGSVEKMDMGHVRSYNAIRFADSVLPPLSSFKVLRVLSLENCDFATGGCRLEHLGMLVQLRYLGIINTPVSELPTDIGHDLKFLQTLHVYETGIQELPPSVGELTKLMCLIASGGTRMMASIGKLTSLEVLELHEVDKSPDFTRDLGKLTQLRVLQIYFNGSDESFYKALVKSVRNLRKLQFVQMESGRLEVGDAWEECDSLSELRQFMLFTMTLSRRPSWMNPSCVPHLSHIFLDLHVLEAGDLHILGRLPSVRFLTLICFNNGLMYTVGSHEFQNLAYLKTNIEIVCEHGALQMLEFLWCRVSAREGVCMVRNIPSLKKIEFELNCRGLSGDEVNIAEAALREAAESHPNYPRLGIDRWIYTDEEEEELEGLDDLGDMIMELGQTVLLLTMGKSNVPAEDLKHYLCSMLSSVLSSPVIHDLLFSLGTQSGLEYPLNIWRRGIKLLTEVHLHDMVDALAKECESESPGDNLSEMMEQMMPVVSQVLAELPPFESTLQPQHNDDGKLGGELESSLQDNDGAETTVTNNEEAAPACLS